MRTRIAICFFGITRSLIHTIGSVEANILAPAQKLGEVRVFAHFFRQATIDNPRSGEKGALRQNEHELLSPDWLELEEPDHCLARHGFEEIKAFGDAWNDEFRSTRNLIHQLHSLNQVTQAAIEWGPNVILFVRPDLIYHDSIEKGLTARRRKRDELFIPGWQNWHGGYNDRFAICLSTQAAEIYGQRVAYVQEFCKNRGEPVHAERLLRYVLELSSIEPRFINVRASRVRFDGTVQPEKFAGPLEEGARKYLKAWAAGCGVLPTLRRLREKLREN